MQVMVENQVLLSQNLNCKTIIFNSLNINSTNRIRKKTLCAHQHYLAHIKIHHSWHFHNTQYWQSHASNHLEVTFWHTSAFFITFPHSLLGWHFANILNGWPAGLEQRNGLYRTLLRTLTTASKLTTGSLPLLTFVVPPLHRTSLGIFL